MRRLLEEAKRLIGIGSISSNGNEELANVAATFLQQRGLKVQLQQVMHSLENVSKRQFNLVGVLGDPLVDKKTRKGLLLTTHLDTVSPGLPENWTETGGNPLASTVKDGRIYGLGAAASKVNFLAMLHAIERYREKKLRMPIYLVGTCGGELGMFGTRYLIKSLTLNPRYVLIGKPTQMGVVYSHKAMILTRISIGYQLVERDARGFNRRVNLHSYGRSAHAAFPQTGTNAITQALDFAQRATDAGFEIRLTRLDGGEMISKVPDKAMVEYYLTSHQLEDFKRFFREVVRSEGLERAFKVELGGLGESGVRFLPDALYPCVMELMGFFRSMASEFQGVPDTTFDPPHSTVTPSLMTQTPGRVDLVFDLRLMPGPSIEETEKRIAQGIGAIASRYPNLNIGVVRERVNPGLVMGTDSELMGILHESAEVSGVQPRFIKDSESTDAAYYHQAGYDTAIAGPGTSMGRSHSPNEFLELDQIERALAFYDKLIEKACA